MPTLVICIQIHCMSAYVSQIHVKVNYLIVSVSVRLVWRLFGRRPGKALIRNSSSLSLLMLGGMGQGAATGQASLANSPYYE